jgi:hypothetical protein
MLSSLTAGGNLTILHLWVYSDRTAMGIIQHVGHRAMGGRASMAPAATARSAGRNRIPYLTYGVLGDRVWVWPTSYQ